MSRFFITGDKHQDYQDIDDFLTRFPELDTEDTTILVLGDMGLCWRKDKKDAKYLTKLYEEKYKANLWFIDGNHENFDILGKLPKNKDGLVHISKHITYIPRGTVLDLPIGKCLFMGGADSVDKFRRIKHLSWWEEETITQADIDAAPAGHYDYLFTHCTNFETSSNFGFILHTLNNITEDTKFHESEKMLSELNKKITYGVNYFGHYHVEKKLDEHHQCLYHNFIELPTKE